MRSSFRRIALFTLSSLTLAGAATAQVCSYRQLTTTSGNFDYLGLSIDNAGARVAFSSGGDYTGGNADGSTELFYADVEAGTVTQASSSILGTSRDALISADGGRIFLGSSSDLTGGNADGNLDVFVYNVAGNTFTQLTSTTGVHTLSSIVRDADSSQLAFSAMFDPTGLNPDGNSEIFLLQTGSLVLTQETNTAGLGTVAGPSLNGSGTRLFFSSDFDLTAGNPDTTSEIFRLDLKIAFNQITSSAADSFYPAATVDDTRVFFVSQANFDGTNADGSQELFVADLNGNGITALTASATGSTLAPRVSANGNWVAFPSNADLVGQNGDGGFEIYLLEVSSGIITQISSHPAGGTAQAAINGNGTRVVFASTSDYTGGNADGSEELFLYDCLGGGPIAVEVPTLGGASKLLLAAVLAAVALGLLLLRRPA